MARRRLLKLWETPGSPLLPPALQVRFPLSLEMHISIRNPMFLLDVRYHTGGMWEPYDPRKPVVLVFKENGATELDSVDETEDERRTLWAALTERDSDVLAGRL